MVTVLIEGPATAPLEEDKPDGSKEPEESKKPDESKQPEGSGVANPNGKCIRFDTKRSCYEITYRADKVGVSKTHRSIAGLTVKCVDKAGKRLTPEKCGELMTRAYEKAKKMWNELGQSKQERFEKEAVA